MFTNQFISPPSLFLIIFEGLLLISYVALMNRYFPFFASSSFLSFFIPVFLILKPQTASRAEFRRVVGQYRYLTRLASNKKHVTGNDEENEEDVCPICQETFGIEVCFLTCAHELCPACTAQLLQAAHSTFFSHSRCVWVATK